MTDPTFSAARRRARLDSHLLRLRHQTAALHRPGIPRQSAAFHRRLRELERTLAARRRLRDTASR